MTPSKVAAVFRITNLDRALAHYRDVFGFTEDFRYGDYAGISRGELHLHLTGSSIHDRPVGGGAVYVFCDEVDAFYADLKQKGAGVKAEPKDYPYGMRDFAVTDLDGNLLSFGCESPGA